MLHEYRRYLPSFSEVAGRFVALCDPASLGFLEEVDGVVEEVDGIG
jgi:hypothetical protein